MGKEVKIGLAVIGLLLCVFGGVLAIRLKREQPANALEKIAAAEKEGKIGKKKSINIGKKSNPGNSEKSASTTDDPLAQPLSSRSGRGKPTPNDAKTDRYGRPLENDWSLPAENEPQAASAGDQASPLELQSTDETEGQTDDRYARYNERNSIQEQPADGGEMPLEENAQDNASLPVDRFAQVPGGLSFSGDEPAENMVEPVDEVGVDEAPDSAPRLMAVPSSNGLDLNDPSLEPREGQEKAVENQAAVDGGDRDLNFSPLPEDEPAEAAPPANDRFANRFRDRQGESAMLAHEEPLDDPSAEEEPAATNPRERWQEPASGSYTVAANDNFWRISQKAYGTGAYFKALEEHNRRQLGNRALLNVGDVVSTPPIEDLQREYPSLSPKPRDVPNGRRSAAMLANSTARGGSTYTVLEGDTLFDIARQELGKASRWAEIYELNRDQLGEDFNYLAPGMRLALPSGSGRNDPIATRPARDGYRR